MTKIERWKPEYGERYWLVDFTTQNSVDWFLWNDDVVDKRNFANHNCFKTQAEAATAAEKVNALLLSLHNEPVTNCNQLPKLTVEVFDRPDCPEWAKWAAVSANGFCYFFENEPSYGVGNFKGQWYVDTGKTCLSSPLAVFNASDWQNSLIERPAKLPEWVEIGGYVYDARNGYGKIVSGSVKSCYIEFDGGAGDFVPEAFAELKQAHLRPYNAEELENLVGKVIETTAQTALVIGFIRQSSRIVCGLMNNYLSGESLLDLGVTIAGKPAGVLEHLENGEWVK